MFFETDEAQYLEVASTFAGEGRHAWASVALDRNGVLFMVSIGPTDRTLAKSHLLGTPERFLEARSELAMANRGAKLTCYVLVPSYLDNACDWKLMALQEVWRGHPKDEEQFSYRYVAPDGSTIDHGFEKYYEEDGLEVILCWDRIL